MSGGHFNYIHDQIGIQLEELRNLIENNHTPDEDGHAPGLKDETIARIEEACAMAERAAAMLKRVDWLYSGDDSEDSFNRRWEDEALHISAAERWREHSVMLGQIASVVRRFCRTPTTTTLEAVKAMDHRIKHLNAKLKKLKGKKGKRKKAERLYCSANGRIETFTPVKPMDWYVNQDTGEFWDDSLHHTFDEAKQALIGEASDRMQRWREELEERVRANEAHETCDPYA